MTYELGFVADALKEWHKLDSGIRAQFKNKLEERLASPRMPSAKLSGQPPVDPLYRFSLQNDHCLRIRGGRCLARARDR